MDEVLGTHNRKNPLFSGLIDEYVAHYNQHRPHRARNLRSPDSRDVTTAMVRDMRTAKYGGGKSCAD